MGKNKKNRDFSSQNDILDGEYKDSNINNMYVVDNDTNITEYNSYSYTYDDSKNVSKRIFFISISIMIIFLIYFIFSSTNNIYKKYEKQLTKITADYIVDNDINIFDNKLSYINISDLKESKLLDDVDATLKKCDGYITFQNQKKKTVYKAYIDCGKYKTKNYSQSYNGAYYAVKIDNEKPIITLNGESEITIYVNDIYEELGAIANDNIDGDITDAIIITGSVDNSQVGVYEIIYEVQDVFGNKAESKRIINVKSKPQITLKGNDYVEINLGSTYEDEGFEAIDLKDGILTDKVIKNDVDYATVGTKEIVYTVTNSQGETTQVIRTIKINSNKYNSSSVDSKTIKVAQVELSVPNLYMSVGEEMQIDSKIIPNGASNKQLKYSSSDNSIASVSNDGKIYAKAAGKVRIKVSSTDGSGTFCTVMLTIN